MVYINHHSYSNSGLSLKGGAKYMSAILIPPKVVIPKTAWFTIESDQFGMLILLLTFYLTNIIEIVRSFELLDR